MASKSNDRSNDKSNDPSTDRKTGRDRLPFEPSSSRKKTDKPAPVSAAAKPSRPASTQRSGAAKDSTRIPDAVGKRMIKRMALFCGVPTALGVVTFFVSYFVVTNDIFDLPPTAVLLVSLGFFGLGVLGLSYGVLSASWDETLTGSRLGWAEFRLNLGRMTDAWRNREPS